MDLDQVVGLSNLEHWNWVFHQFYEIELWNKALWNWGHFGSFENYISHIITVNGILIKVPPTSRARSTLFLRNKNLVTYRFGACPDEENAIFLTILLPLVSHFFNKLTKKITWLGFSLKRVKLLSSQLFVRKKPPSWLERRWLISLKSLDHLGTDSNTHRYLVI